MVVQILEDAALGVVDLLAGPHSAAPVGLVGECGVLCIVDEFDGEDEGGEDEELGVDGVDVWWL